MLEMCTKAMFINKLNNVFGGNTRDVLYVNLKINRTNKNKSLFLIYINILTPWMIIQFHCSLFNFV